MSNLFNNYNTVWKINNEIDMDQLTSNQKYIENTIHDISHFHMKSKNIEYNSD
jgi:hypothetical protein